MIDFSELALSPNESRAARNFLGLSQAQAAEKSNLPTHKIKRFESGNYVPDCKFLEGLREFYEGEGFNFHDEDAPGAKAKARGDVFPAGVVGDTDGNTDETDGSPSGNQGKLPRPQSVQLQFMRITPSLESAQVDRVFDCIEDNEEAVRAGMALPIRNGFLSESPSGTTQAQAIALLRRLAENGLLYARLMGRELVSVPSVNAQTEGDGFLLMGATKTKAATVGDLLALAMGDMQRAVVDGDTEAQARRKGRAEPVEVLQALIG
ncbi:MAG: helix-turn-helix transcriptional regulator [Acidovorax sp.]|nr:helix-turn-helix transcriptional regulator [Acidovorax sp.]